jgi:hypothetical protein
MSYRQQVDSARAAIRPELILSGWQATTKDPRQYSNVTFDEIENVGVAPAFNVMITGVLTTKKRGNDPLQEFCSVEPARTSILRQSEKRSVDVQCNVLLPAPISPKALPDLRMAPLEINVLFSDSAGTRYCTTYEMLLSTGLMSGAEVVTPGLDISIRRTGLYRRCLNAR